jgi:hypothetical protein
MIALFTDFGLHGPYTGQVKAVLHGLKIGSAVELETAPGILLGL